MIVGAPVRLGALVAVAALVAGAPSSVPDAPGDPHRAPAARAPAAPSPVPRPVRYQPPVAPLRVVRGFEPPPTPYAAGHRGVDLAVSPGQPVGAAAAGTVTFAGAVAGRGVVVIAHADGIRTEYEPVRPAVRAGTAVTRGQPVGVVAGSHGGCAPGRCLHWGARRGNAYLDPLSLIAPLGPVRLLPWSAAPRAATGAAGGQARGWACRYTARSRSIETWV